MAPYAGAEENITMLPADGHLRLHPADSPFNSAASGKYIEMITFMTADNTFRKIPDQPFRRLPQDFIASGIPHRTVDFLEPINIKADNCPVSFVEISLSSRL